MKIYVFGIFLFYCFSATGQVKVFNKDFNLSEKTPLFASYYGNIGVHPGVKLGFDYALIFKEKTKAKKRKTKTIRKVLFVSPSIAFYSHKNSNKGLFISSDLLWRRYTKRLYITELGVGIGYYRRFNSGKTYEVTSSGVRELGITSRGYFSPSVSYSFGKRFLIREMIPTEVFLRSNYNVILNYNSSVGSEISLELGIRMSFKYGIKQGKVKTIIKSK